MKILISSYTGIGNFILKTPMISTIRDKYPSAEIDIITDNGLGIEHILKKNYIINKVIILNKKDSLIKKISFFLKLRKSKYDLVLLPFDSQPLFLIFGSYISNIKQRIIHLLMHNKKKTIFSILMPGTLCVQALPNRHEIDLNYDLFECYLNTPVERKYQTFVDIKKDVSVFTRFKLEKYKYIILQVGAANGAKSAKKWRIENFKELIGKINTNYEDYQVILVGDAGDYQNDIKLLEGLGLGFINTAGLTSINEVINLLQFSKLVVSHDSGIMHIANSLNCNLIALYGPTDHTRTSPLGNKSTILYSKTSCFCKMYNFGASETDLYYQYPNCMDGISVENVMNEIDNLIGK
jgi:lipopolysaccharide heptosyltransferase II